MDHVACEKMAETRSNEEGKGPRVRAVIKSRDIICTNCLKTIRKGKWVVECECGRKYDMDCSFDLRNCTFCGSNLFSIVLFPDKKRVSIDQFLSHINRYLKHFKGSEKDAEAPRTSDVNGSIRAFTGSSVLSKPVEMNWNPGMESLLRETELYCARTMEIQNSFVSEGKKAHINCVQAANFLERAETALSAHDMINTLTFLGRTDREIRKNIIAAINNSSQLMKNMMKEGMNIRIIENLVSLAFNSFEEGKILASIYYLRRVSGEVERMRTASDPISFCEEEDFYSLIGAEKDAVFSEIKKAYRKKIAKLHPDSHATSNEEIRKRAESGAKALNRAYNTLKDVRERRLYDIAMGFSEY